MGRKAGGGIYSQAGTQSAVFNVQFAAALVCHVQVLLIR